MVNTGLTRDEIRAYCGRVHARASVVSPAAIDEQLVDFYAEWLNPDTRPEDGNLDDFKAAWSRFNRDDTMRDLDRRIAADHAPAPSDDAHGDLWRDWNERRSAH